MRTTIKLALLCFMSSHCSSAEKTLNDSGMNTDADEDGYTLGDGDCNDNDPSIHPGAIEQCDDVDRDCDGLARNNVIVDYEASRVSIWGGRLSVYDGTLTSKINSSLLGLSFPGREGTSNWEPVSYTSRWIGYDRSGEDFANHAGGQVLYVEEDSNSDGRVDENSSYTYDASGNLLLVESENDSSQETRTYTYDPEGRLTYQESLLTESGRPEPYYRYSTSYTYDEAGLLVLMDTSVELIDVYTTYYAYEMTYDGQGNLETQKLVVSDETGAVTLEELSTYAYDSEGRQTLYEYDRDIDGTIDFTETWTYDAQGRLLNHVQTDAGDERGRDESMAYAYDKSGNLLTYVYRSGKIPLWKEVHEYDAGGNRTSHEERSDGVRIRKWVAEYDDEIGQVVQSMDWDANGMFDSRYVYTLDVDGNLVAYAGDTNGDGIPEESLTATCVGPVSAGGSK